MYLQSPQGIINGDTNGLFVVDPELNPEPMAVVDPNVGAVVPLGPHGNVQVGTAMRRVSYTGRLVTHASLLGLAQCSHRMHTCIEGSGLRYLSLQTIVYICHLCRR